MQLISAKLISAQLIPTQLISTQLISILQSEIPILYLHYKRKNMLPVKLKILILSLITSLIFSCSKPANNNIITCRSLTQLLPRYRKDQRVQYLAGTSGNGGTISSVSYLDSAGTTTVQNPVLPLTVYVNLKKGQYASMSAKGTANQGGAIIIYITSDSLQNGYACSN